MFWHREADRSGASLLAGLGDGDQQVERGADRFGQGQGRELVLPGQGLSGTDRTLADRAAQRSLAGGAARRVLDTEKITGEDGGEIDHIELFGPPANPHNHSRNFVLCPGSAYDRSPCGTGTSTKLACLAADGKLAPGAIWRQESILGSVFEGSYRRDGAKIIPRITGTAYVNAEATLLLDPRDPFEMGIRTE